MTRAAMTAAAERARGPIWAVTARRQRAAPAARVLEARPGPGSRSLTTGAGAPAPRQRAAGSRAAALAGTAPGTQPGSGAPALLAAGARVLVAALLEALRRAVARRRGVVLRAVRRRRGLLGRGSRRRARRAGRAAAEPAPSRSCRWSPRALCRCAARSARAAPEPCRPPLVVAPAAGAASRASASSASSGATRGRLTGGAIRRSTAGSRRPQWGQSLRSFWTSCSSEQPHMRRFSTE